MSIEAIHMTAEQTLLDQRAPIWYWNDSAARKDIVQSAQNCADTSGDPQYIVDKTPGSKTLGYCTEIIVSDTRRALAVHPQRFIDEFARQDREAAARVAAATGSRSDGAGPGA